jgi:hypothetical protein
MGFLAFLGLRWKMAFGFLSRLVVIFRDTFLCFVVYTKFAWRVGFTGGTLFLFFLLKGC